MKENCKALHFKEVVQCKNVGGWIKAHGWTESSGRFGGFPYIPPTGWEYDMDYRDVPGGLGTHGGCSYCAMTLVHLRKRVSGGDGVVPIIPGKAGNGDMLMLILVFGILFVITSRWL